MITLDALPTGTAFEWYRAADTFDITSGASGTRKESYVFTQLNADTVQLVKPVVPGPTSPWTLAGGFPPGRFTVYAAESDATVSMRWTGLADNNLWHNPDNWVEVHKNGSTSYETPAFRSPSRCTIVSD